ncbi:PREDICTED: WD repeat-containing protein 63 [Elephantulus edwardii]|uniref:WD repeat-containing protein 63 n=1 Tax=Elephantulus edwardii TaxID=28737 RepID=UPI0003F08EF1|nr:PREDICTED: WD repeat-containing protein 63 [Elephantulus edwardii]
MVDVFYLDCNAGHPEIFPLVLSTKTQEIFNCRINEDITDEKPYKLIKKEDIIEDLNNRAAVSDFYPVKKVILEYPGPEILLVYDKDFKYGLNFYIIGTEEGKENYFNAPEVPEEQEEYKEGDIEDKHIYKPPVSKPWVSLGSEKEIDDESVKESKRQITYMISRKRREFGAPIKFSDYDASSVKDTYIECTAYQDKNFTVKQLEKDVALLAVPKVSDISTQTKWTYPKNATTQYYPREFSEEEKETLSQSKPLADFLNNLMLEGPDDIFCFKFCPSDPNIIAGGCINGQIVLWDITAHADRIENIKTGSTRSKKNTLKPIFLLEPDSNKEAMYIRHCAISSIENGHKKVITDIHWLSDTFEINRTGTVFENRNEICCQLVTCSADCTICFWDLRPQKTLTPQTTEKKKEETIEIPSDIPSTFFHLDLTWKPFAKIKLSKGETSIDHCPIKLGLNEDHLVYKSQEKLLAQGKAIKAGELSIYHNLEIETNSFLKPIEEFCTKFFVGTEEGEVVYTDWKMERDPDTGRLAIKKPVSLCGVHDGAVNTILRSPFYKDIVLTIGGWNVAIWKEGVMFGPLFKSCCAPKKYTSGHWSLTRPGVFFIGREDGFIDIWDLLEKTHEPALSQNICVTMITYVKPWTLSAKQQFIAIADYYGTLHILEIPWTLSHPSTNEVASVSYYFEREVKHLEYVEERKKIRKQEKQQMEMEMEEDKNKTYKKSKEQVEADLKLDYDSYLELEKNILVNLGLIKAIEPLSYMESM